MHVLLSRLCKEVKSRNTPTCESQVVQGATRCARARGAVTLTLLYNSYNWQQHHHRPIINHNAFQRTATAT
jgi:hypothetical protein